MIDTPGFNDSNKKNNMDHAIQVTALLKYCILTSMFCASNNLEQKIHDMMLSC